MRRYAGICVPSIFILLLLVSCKTSPEFRQFSTNDGIMFFIPPTDWKTDASDTARLDITYQTGNEIPVTVNITFFGKKTTPRMVTYVTLSGAGLEYPLTNFRALYADSKKRELRITTEGNRDTLIALLEAETITLTAEIDGARYTYTPNTYFLNMKNDFLTVISYN